DAAASMDVKAAPRELAECKADAEALLALLKNLKAPRLRRPLPFIVCTVLAWVLLCGLSWLTAMLVGIPEEAGPPVGVGMIAGTLIAAVAALIGHVVLTRRAHNGVRALFLPLCRLALEAEATKGVLDERYKVEYQETVTQAKNKHNDEVRQTHAKL